jgi:hypothetical protein
MSKKAFTLFLRIWGQTHIHRVGLLRPRQHLGHECLPLRRHRGHGFTSCRYVITDEFKWPSLFAAFLFTIFNNVYLKITKIEKTTVLALIKAFISDFGVIENVTTSCRGETCKSILKCTLVFRTIVAFANLLLYFSINLVLYKDNNSHHKTYFLIQLILTLSSNIPFWSL